MRLTCQWLTLVDFIMDVNNGLLAEVDVSKPGFIVVEAKRTAKLPDSSSVAELVGQLTSQLIRTYTSLRLVLPVNSFILTFPCLFLLVNYRSILVAPRRILARSLMGGSGNFIWCQEVNSSSPL